MKRNGGFTLIEVLVALAIFAFIALGTGTAVTRSLQVKKIMEERWEENRALETAMAVMERDIYLAFHRQAIQPGADFRIRDTSFRTFFKARGDQMDFTSLSHRRLYENRHESEMCEIGYHLVEERGISGRKQLARRFSTYIDDQPEKGGDSQAILDSVEKLQFRFYSKKDDRWHEAWDSEHIDFRDRFPEAVEIQLTLARRGEKVTYTTQVPLAFPNNERPGEGRP